MKKHINIALLFLLVLQPALAGDALVSLAIQEGWSNVFGGRETIFHITVASPESFHGKLGWRFSSAERTIAKAEREVTVKPAAPETVAVPLQVPEVKEGAVIQAALSVSVFSEAGNVVTNITKNLWIFSEDPFAEKKKWLKDLNIKLFDPEKKTAELFRDAEIPFVGRGNIDSFSEIENGILVIGEGVSLKDYRGLSKMMVETAASGIPVLCLALAGGKMVVPGMGEVDLPRTESMSFRRNDIITELDKRLDADAWPPDGRVAAGSVKIRGERGPVTGEIMEEGDGWPWVEMDFGNKEGRLVICGFGIIEKWNSGPAPRYLFARLLEYINEQKREVRESKSPERAQ